MLGLEYLGIPLRLMRRPRTGLKGQGTKCRQRLLHLHLLLSLNLPLSFRETFSHLPRPILQHTEILCPSPSSNPRQNRRMVGIPRLDHMMTIRVCSRCRGRHPRLSTLTRIGSISDNRGIVIFLCLLLLRPKTGPLHHFPPTQRHPQDHQDWPLTAR